MEPEQQAQQLESPDQRKSRRERKRSRWGAETEAGLKVLAGGEVEQVQAPVVEQQQVQQPVQATDGGAEAGRKKRRSRWEPETEAKPAVLQGLQIALPPSIAALVDAHVDPKVTELQRQLNIVSTCSIGSSSLYNSIISLNGTLALCTVQLMAACSCMRPPAGYNMSAQLLLLPAH